MNKRILLIALVMLSVLLMFSIEAPARQEITDPEPVELYPLSRGPDWVAFCRRRSLLWPLPTMPLLL